MDQCMIKLTGPYPVGTEVTLIGNDGDESISVDEIAAKLETINYEVTCMIRSKSATDIYERQSGESCTQLHFGMNGL